MRKLILIAAIIAAAFAVIAATQTDSLAEIQQAIADLTAQGENHEARLAYLERFQPEDTFQSLEGAGSMAELAANVNSRILQADGIEIAVTGAEIVSRQSEIRTLALTYGNWIKPTSGNLVKVDVNIYSTSRAPAQIKIDMCPWETQNTLATDYAGNCEKVVFWNIEVDGESYPLVTPGDSTDTWIMEAQDVTVSQFSLFFHVDTSSISEGLLTYKHPANENSHRYWKLQRDR